MRWFEYKAEVDNLHASDELKAKLLAMQAGAGTAAAAPAKKPPVRFPLKRAAGMAACFVLGIGVCGAAILGTAGGLLRAGSGGAASTAAYYSMDTGSAAGAAENGWSLSDARMAAGVTEDMVAAAPEAAPLEAGSSRSTHKATTERKIIYTARLYLESKTYDETRAALEATLAELGGYVEACDEYSYADSPRSVTLTLRIPAENYQSFLSSAEGAGNLRSKSEQADDITAQYIDVAVRIANLEAQRDRLNELEAQAETLSDLLEIQSTLTDVQSQLESWQSQMAWYNDQVDYCTVTVDLSEVKEYTPVRESFGERLTGALTDGWTAFVDGLQSAAVWLAYSWPVLLLLAAAAGIGVAVVRRRRKRNR